MNIVRQNPEHTGASAPSRTEWDPARTMRDLLRWDPFRDARWADPFREMAPLGGTFVPSVDVRETQNEYILEADVPGLGERDIEISVTGNRLSISGKREDERREESDTFYAMERQSGSFCRTFTMPEGADLGSVQADLSAGVLTVTVPKRTEVKPRRVNVRSGGAEGQRAPEPTGGEQTGNQRRE